MSEPRWLTPAVVRALHMEAVVQFGGLPGLRDKGLLESALARPRQILAYGNDPDLFALAAAYATGILRNPPFVDGNKRVAFATMAIFLRLNGFDLRVTADDAEAFLIEELIQARAPLATIATWIEQHLHDSSRVLYGRPHVERR